MQVHVFSVFETQMHVKVESNDLPLTLERLNPEWEEFSHYLSPSWHSRSCEKTLIWVLQAVWPRVLDKGSDAGGEDSFSHGE